MNDKITEIRARHERIQRDCTLATPPGSMAGQVAAVDAHDDRTTLLAEVERLRADLALEKSRIVLQRGEIERLRADVERLRTVYVLIASRQSGPVDSATCWYEDKIIGCYISREAAEGVAKLLMADWRINEYALVGKP